MYPQRNLKYPYISVSQKTPPVLVPGPPEIYESEASALGETFTENLTNPDSQEFHDMEERFCQAVRKITFI